MENKRLGVKTYGNKMPAGLNVSRCTCPGVLYVENWPTTMVWPSTNGMSRRMTDTMSTGR